MNRLTIQDRVRILTVLSGVGINAGCRATGASKGTLLKMMPCWLVGR